MKLSIGVLFFTLTTAQAFQRDYQFLLMNSAPINAYIYDTDCTTPLAGPGFLAQAYVGTSSASLKPFFPQTYFVDRGRFEDVIITVPGVAPGMYVQVQVVAWDKSAGATYETAVASGGKYGFSSIFPVRLGEPPDLSWGLQSFCLIPEPSTWAMLTLGGLGLALARFKGRR